MNRLSSYLKTALLLSALAIVAWSALPSNAQADTVCEGAGHSCHVEIGSTTYHLKKVETF